MEASRPVTEDIQQMTDLLFLQAYIWIVSCALFVKHKGSNCVCNYIIGQDVVSMATLMTTCTVGLPGGLTRW